MKHWLLLSWAALMMFAACVTEPLSLIPEEPADLQQVVLTAGWEGATRTSLGSGLTGTWTSGDRLAVYDGIAIRCFTLVRSDGPTALFEGKMDISAKTYYAAYPFEAATQCESGNWTLSIPSSQCIAAGDSVAVGALVSVATFTDPKSVSLRNATGLVRVQVAADDITRIQLKGNGGETLSGSVQVTSANGTVSSFTEARKDVTLTHASGTFPKGNYYFAVAPATLASGPVLSLWNNDGLTATKTGGNSLTVPRSGGVNLGDVTTGLTWKEDLVLDSGDTDDSDDNVANTTFDRRVRVVYSASGAKVTGLGSKMTAEVEGNDVTITNNGKETVIYDLSGSATDGFFKLYSGKKQAIVLNGLSLKNPSGASINNQSKKRTFVFVSGTNSLEDGVVASSGDYPDQTEGEDMKAAFFSEGQLIFSGDGSLTVTANGKAGISSDDYVRVMSSPAITVSASAGHAVRGKDFIQIDNGTIKASTSANMKKGFSSDSLVVITGGTTTITVTGSAAYDSEEGDYDGTAGIKADKCFLMSGGTVTITNSGRGGKGIRVGGNSQGTASPQVTVEPSVISGGKLTVTTTGAAYQYMLNGQSESVSSKGIMTGWAIADGHTYSSFSGDLLMSGGVVSVNCTYAEAIEAKGTLDVTGGEVYAFSKNEDAINSVSTMTLSGGYVCGISSGNDGIDSNGNLYIDGGVVYAVGKGSPEMAIDANTEGGFKLYVRGGTLFALGNLERGASLTQSCWQSSSWSKNAWYSLTVGDATFAFRTPSSGGKKLVVSGASKPEVKRGVTVSAGTPVFDGNGCLGASVSGGTAVSLSNYTSSMW